MSEAIWFFDKLYVRRRLDFDEWAVIPLQLQEVTFRAAAEAYVALKGAELDLKDRLLPEVDVAAIVFPLEDATDPDQALAATSGQARVVASALAFGRWVVAAYSAHSSRLEARRSAA